MLSNSLKNFRNAHWFKNHLYAYKNLWKRRQNLKSGRKFLYNAELFFDSRCNLHCLHCSIAKFQKQPNFKHTMTLKEIERVADQLKRMDCFLCCLVGGETTIRPDLIEIIKIFHQRQILPTIITNGYLIDRAYMVKMKEAGIFNIGVSLNGSRAKTHDDFVRVKGAFKKAINTIKLAKELNICTSIAVVPTHENLKNGDYQKLMKYAQKNNIRVNVNYPALTGKYTNCYEELLTQPEIDQVRQYFRHPNITSDFTVLADKYECPAGRKKIYILPDGSVCPCTFIHLSFGNILTEPLSRIMNRLWSTKIFMSRPNICLVGESLKFNERFLEPIFESKTLPIYYKNHPEFKDLK
jgi:MoaA/NifB/PqqE/SkfB family radical SAM enzyme